MPVAQTAHFGPIEYVEGTEVEFPAGLPAFEEETRFIVLRDDQFEPLVFLQSLRTPGLAFLAISVKHVALDYRIELSEEDLRLLRADRMGSSLDALALVTVSPGRDVTANLQAPVLINHEARVAIQVIRADSVYSNQHPLGAHGTQEGQPCS